MVSKTCHVVVESPLLKKKKKKKNQHQDFPSTDGDGQTKDDLASNIISFACKFKPYKSFVTSILLYGCETWILLLTLFFETKYLRKLLRNFFLELKTNDWLRSRINFLVGPQEPLLAMSRDGHLHGSNMPRATTASLKPSFRPP